MTGFDALVDVVSGQPPSADGSNPPAVHLPGFPIPVVASVSPEHAALSRMVGRGCQVGLPHLGAGTTLTVLRADGETADWTSAITLEGPFGAIVLAQGERLLRALSGVDLSQEQDADDDRWSWLQAALIARLEETPFASVERLSRAAQPEGADVLTLNLTLRSGQHAVTVAARARATAWLRFLRQATWARVQQPPSASAGLPIEIPLRIARHALPAHALNHIAAGDIILPDAPAFTCSGTGSLRIGDLSLKVRFEAPGMLEVIQTEGSVNTEYRRMDAPGEGSDDYDDDIDGNNDIDGNDYDYDERNARHGRNDDHDDDGGAIADAADGDHYAGATAAPAAAIAGADRPDLDALPISLEFSLGKARLSLGELRALGPGAILTIEGGSPAAIAILSGGRLLGRGEAVDVAGQLGIRVTQWGSV